MFDVSKSVVQKLNIPSLSKRKINVFVKRDDLIHDEVSGNKWRKLKYNVELCSSRSNEGVLTFGGAYSNHLLATASACNYLGVKSIAIVRGDELNENSNETLRNCNRLGMKLVFTSRKQYSMRYEKVYQEQLSYQFPNYLIVPEGGANYHGMIGCQEIMPEIEQHMDHVFVAQGTSTTSCGILMSLNNKQQLHVVPALKGYHSIEEMSALFLSSGMEEEWTSNSVLNVDVLDQYHFGGYGKYTEELLFFIRDFFTAHQIKLDPIYTGKAMFALLKEIEDSKYDGTDVLFVHTGGVQGSQGIIDKSGVELYG
jgi:1-aminocyclopropane-1-carboxylate deaminase/D-cysteine desulfhydrase-like pyridoxal-dependent ACC family enzyme